jgi:integrase
MSEQRVTVWVQRFKDRAHLMLQWTDPETGRRKSQSAGTADEKEAEQARADLEYELNHGKYQEASRMSWERFRELFEAEYVAAKRQNTRENYTAMFNVFERVCGPKTLKGVNERMISLFAAGLRKAPGRAQGSVGQAPSTIRQRLQLLRKALAWAVEQKMLPVLPRFPAVKVPKKKPQPVPTETFEWLLLKAPDANMRAYLLAGWLGGLRLAEAAALEWEATEEAPYLDPTNNRIVLPAAFAKAAEDQWVPLDPLLWEAIQDLPREGRKVFRFVAKDGHAVCLNAIGERVIRLAKKAGVKLTMHSLRRGFGCRYAGKVSAQVLQKLMRHSNVSITMAYYANVDDAVMEAVLGAQRNSSRNTTPATPEGADTADGATLCPARGSAAG